APNERMPMITLLPRMPRKPGPRWSSVLLPILIAGAGFGARAAEVAPPQTALELKSPDGRIAVAVNAAGTLSYRLAVDGTQVLNDSRLGLRLRDFGVLGGNVVQVDAARAENDSTWTNPLRKRREVRDHYRER